MRLVIFVTLLLISLPDVVLADDLIIIDENGVGWAIADDGSRIPFNLDDIEVLASRPPPKEPGFCINTSNFTLWWGGQGWHVCWDDEWETFDTPTFSVLLGGKLVTGEFISSDNNHTVEAVIDDVERIEQWNSIDKSGVSGILDFNPKTGKVPKIIFKVSSVAKGTGRTKPLAYTVKAKIGPLAAESAKFEQTNVHQLRQEYVDVGQKKTPKADKFDQSVPAYPKLKDVPHDVHRRHKWAILNLINKKARALDAAYAHPFTFTSGYRCPSRNHHHGYAKESQHVYGTAFDFDAGGPNLTASKRNYDLFLLGKSNASVNCKWRALYDDKDSYYTTVPTWDTLPANFSGKYYMKGHMDWRD